VVSLEHDEKGKRTVHGPDTRAGTDIEDFLFGEILAIGERVKVLSKRTLTSSAGMGARNSLSPRRMVR
jgi:hypothetical protein